MYRKETRNLHPRWSVSTYRLILQHTTSFLHQESSSSSDFPFFHLLNDFHKTNMLSVSDQKNMTFHSSQTVTNHTFFVYLIYQAVFFFMNMRNTSEALDVWIAMGLTQTKPYSSMAANLTSADPNLTLNIPYSKFRSPSKMIQTF